MNCLVIRAELITYLRGRNSRKPFRIFKDMKSSKIVSPIVWVSLELSCSRVPHTRSIVTFTSSAAYITKTGQSQRAKNTAIPPQCQRCTSFSSCLYVMLKKSTLTALWDHKKHHCEKKRHLTIYSQMSFTFNLPVKQFVVDILCPLYIYTHCIHHLHQLLQLLLQSLHSNPADVNMVHIKKKKSSYGCILQCSHPVLRFISCD